MPITDQLNIRVATENDIELLTQFNIRMAMETESLELKYELVNKGVAAVINNPTLGFYLIAEYQEKTAGSLMVTYEWSDWRNGMFWWVQSVFVPSEFRRQGVYRTLYAKVKELASTKENVAGFRLYVEKQNTTAIRTYESMGMKETYYRLFEE